MSSLAVDHPWLLWLLALALPLLAGAGERWNGAPALAAVPRDRLSALLDAALRLAGALAVAGLVLGLAGLHRSEQSIERTGRGAHVVLVLDRSISMDQRFDSRAAGAAQESKTAAAVRLVAEFFARRPHDRFGLVAFSTAPMLAVPLTDRRGIVAAALAAMRRPALDHTDIGRGVALGLSLFQDSSPQAPRVLLLVSDGAGVIDAKVQNLIRAQARKLDAHIYYLYLRTEGDPGLHAPAHAGDADQPAALDRFLADLGVPYRGFEADSPGAVSAAIREIDRLETHPVSYRERIARRDYGRQAYALAALGLLLLVLARFAERDLAPAAPGEVRPAR